MPIDAGTPAVQPMPVLKQSPKSLTTVKETTDAGRDRRTAVKQYHAAAVSTFASPSPPPSNEHPKPPRVPRLPMRASSPRVDVSAPTPSRVGSRPIELLLLQAAKDVPSLPPAHAMQPPPVMPPPTVRHATPSPTGSDQRALSGPASSGASSRSSPARARWALSEPSCATSAATAPPVLSTALMVSPGPQRADIEVVLTPRPRPARRAASRRWALAASAASTSVRTRGPPEQTALANVVQKSAGTIVPMVAVPMPRPRRWTMAKSVALSVPTAIAKPSGEVCDCVWTSAASMSCAQCPVAAPAQRPTPYPSAQPYTSIPAPRPPAATCEPHALARLFRDPWRSTTSITHRTHAPPAVPLCSLGALRAPVHSAVPGWSYDHYVNATLRFAKAWVGFTLVTEKGSTAATSTTSSAAAVFRPWAAVSYASA